MKQTTTTGTRNAARFSSESLFCLTIAVCVAALAVFLIVPYLPITRAEALSLATVAGGVLCFCVAYLGALADNLE